MTATQALPSVGHGWLHRHASGEATAKPVEIFAPDRRSTDLLLEYAAPLFPAELAPGAVWIVRLQPPPTGGGWAVEFLSLVRRWLEAARLPCANVLYDGRSYLIRASTDVAQFARAEDPDRALATQAPS
jgi:hypothetical protein